MFFHACRAGGCSPPQARILYAGVRIGAWAAESLPDRALSRENLLFRKGLDTLGLEEQFLRGKLSEISQEMEALPDEASIESLDAVIECHLRV
jgi:hypothetical protein